MSSTDNPLLMILIFLAIESKDTSSIEISGWVSSIDVDTEMSSTSPVSGTLGWDD